MELKTRKAHPEFDLRRARKVYAGVEELEGEQVASPFDLYSVEELRDRHKLRVKPGFATDVFVWGLGPGTAPHLTKVSGVPFWPKKKAWPLDDEGNPMIFLAQFCFLDSKDLVPRLPGDLLLIFVPDNEDEWLWGSQELEGVRFEWLAANEKDLMEELPRGLKNYGENEWHGVIHRTADYPDASDKVGAMRQGYNLPILNATKIGGVPHGIQSGPEFEADPTKGLPKMVTTGEEWKAKPAFLCQLTSIQAAPRVPYPWTNREQALTLDSDERGIYDEAQQCTFGDMGTIYIFIDDEGACSAKLECY